MSAWITFDTAAMEPEEGAPPQDRLISGNPTFRTWNFEEAAGGIYAGVWEATPGTWHIAYDEWEYFRVISGYSIVTEAGGEPVHLHAGDSMVLRPGFKGTWQVVETTRKDYVIRL
jgi:uncharacterized cupin superfamily protein